MSWILIVEQSLNGLQFGLMLFLLAAGLTLVFGTMDIINLAHGSLYMLGAFLAATLVQATGSFAAGVLLAIPATAILGMLLEGSGRPPPYSPDHLSRGTATFEAILILALVVIVIGGIGSIRGALVGSLLVGIVDTIGRAFLPILFGLFFQPRVASAAGPAIASVLVYLLMAVVLYFKPQGLFPARG